MIRVVASTRALSILVDELAVFALLLREKHNGGRSSFYRRYFGGWFKSLKLSHGWVCMRLIIGMLVEIVVTANRILAVTMT